MQNPTPEHQRLIKAAIATFSSRGFKILEAANINGYPSPQAHGKYEPDIVMKDPQGLIHLVEVKTEDDIFTQRTKDQINEFARRIMPFDKPSLLSGQSIPLHLIVYYKDVPKIAQVIDELNLGALVGTKIIVHWLDQND